MFIQEEELKQKLNFKYIYKKAHVFRRENMSVLSTFQIIELIIR